MERLARLILYLPLCVYASSALEGGRSAPSCDCDDLSSPTEIRFVDSKPPNFKSDISFGTSACEAALVNIVAENNDLVTTLNFQAAIDCGGFIEETLAAGSGNAFETLYEFPPISIKYTTDQDAQGKALIEAKCQCPLITIPDSVKYCQATAIVNADPSTFDFHRYPDCSDSTSIINIPFLNSDGSIKCPKIVLVDDFNDQYVVSYTEIDGTEVEFNCPRVGQWSNWAEWSSCIGICGNGERTRSRSCNGGDVSTGECTLIAGEVAVSDKSTVHTEVCDTTFVCGNCPEGTILLDGRCACVDPTNNKAQWFLIDMGYSASFSPVNFDLFGATSKKVLVRLLGELGSEDSPNVINFSAATKDRSLTTNFFPSNIKPKKFFWTNDKKKLVLVFDEGLILLDSLQYPFNPNEGVAAEISSMSFDVNFIKVTAVFSDGSEQKSQEITSDDWCTPTALSVGSLADNSVVTLTSNCDDKIGFCKLDTVCPASVDNDLCLCNHDKNPTCKLSSDYFYVTRDFDSCSTCTERSCQRRLYGCFPDNESDEPIMQYTYETCNSDKLYCHTICTEDQVFTEWIEDDAEKIENCEQKCGEQFYTRHRDLRPNAENLLCSIPLDIKLEEQILCNTRCCGHKSEVTSISAPFRRGAFCYRTEYITESCDNADQTYKTVDIKIPCSDPGLQICSAEHVKSCIDITTHQVKHIEGCQGILFEKKLACDTSCTYGRQTYYYTCGGEEIVASQYTTDEVDVCNPDSTGCMLVRTVSDDASTCEEYGITSCAPVPNAVCTNTVFDKDEGIFKGLTVTEHCIVTLGDHGIPCNTYEEHGSCTLPLCEMNGGPKVDCCENMECGYSSGEDCNQIVQSCYDSFGGEISKLTSNCCSNLDMCTNAQLFECPPCNPNYPECAMEQSIICNLQEENPCEIRRDHCTCDNFDCSLTGFDLDTIRMDTLEETGLILPHETYGDKLVIFVGHEGTAQKCTSVFDRAAAEVKVHYKYNDMIEFCGATLMNNVFRAEIYIDSQKVMGTEFFSSRVHFASVQCSLPPPKDLEATPLSMIPRLNPIKFTDVIPGATEVSFELARDPLFMDIITNADTTSNMLFIESMVYARVNSPTAVTIESCEVTDLKDPGRKRYIIKNRCILPDMKTVFGMKFTKVASNGNTELEWQNFFFRDNLEDRQQLQYKCFVTHCRGTPCQPTSEECEAIQRGNRRRRSALLEIPEGVDIDASAIEFWVEAFRYMETLNRAKLTINKTHHTEKVILVLDWVNNILFTLTFATLIAFLLLFYKRNVDEETKTIRIFEKTFYYGARRRSRDENSNKSSQLPVQIKKIDSGLPSPAFRDF